MQSCYVYILLKQQGHVQGACKILVEQKSGDEAFGKGRKVHMTFGELVQQLEQGNDSLYLTTQEVGTIPRAEFAEPLNCASCLRQQRRVFVVTSNKPFTTLFVLSFCPLLQCIANGTTFISPSLMIWLFGQECCCHVCHFSIDCWHVQTGVDAAGQPNIMAPPVSKLRKEFPLRPECMGNLVPQQINLWMGAASNGTSLCHRP